MNPRIKQRWLDALRSGEYKQTMENLQDSNGFCCLGVLCDLHAQERGMNWVKRTDGYELYGETQLLPLSVQEWAGLDNHMGGLVDFEYEKDGVMYVKSKSLPEINDAWNKNFNEIADLIETQL
jgi:hypothetical protein